MLHIEWLIAIILAQDFWPPAILHRSSRTLKTSDPPAFQAALTTEYSPSHTLDNYIYHPTGVLECPCGKISLVISAVFQNDLVCSIIPHSGVP